MKNFQAQDSLNKSPSSLISNISDCSLIWFWSQALRPEALSRKEIPRHKWRSLVERTIVPCSYLHETTPKSCKLISIHPQQQKEPMTIVEPTIVGRNSGSKICSAWTSNKQPRDIIGGSNKTFISSYDGMQRTIKISPQLMIQPIIIDKSNNRWKVRPL